MWADNGDDISIQYSGTPALKGDFVRYFVHPTFFKVLFENSKVLLVLCWNSVLAGNWNVLLSSENC